MLAGVGNREAASDRRLRFRDFREENDDDSNTVCLEGTGEVSTGAAATPRLPS
jgi:hypothetical protein